MNVPAEVAAAIIAGLLAVAFEQWDHIERDDRFRVAVAADIRSIVDLIQTTSNVEPAKLFEGKLSPLNAWDSAALHIGDLPERAVEPVATFYSKLRGMIGVVPNDNAKMAEWRDKTSAAVSACGLWAVYQLTGGTYSADDWQWSMRLADKRKLSVNGTPFGHSGGLKTIAACID